MTLSRTLSLSQNMTQQLSFSCPKMCKPQLDPKSTLILEEDKLKVAWNAADIEVWLKTDRSRNSGPNWNRKSKKNKISVDSYEVTIFPAESVINAHTIPAFESESQSASTGNDIYSDCSTFLVFRK